MSERKRTPRTPQNPIPSDIGDDMFPPWNGKVSFPTEANLEELPGIPRPTPADKPNKTLH